MAPHRVTGLMKAPAKKARAKRGDWVGVHIRGHDGGADCYALWRAVKVSREGTVTHVVEPEQWNAAQTLKCPVRANAGTALSYHFIEHVYVGVPQLNALADIAGGSVFRGGYPTLGELQDAIREIMRKRNNEATS